MQPKTHFGYIIRDLFSGKDNYSLDIGRILWTIGVIEFMGITFYSIVADKNFDFIAWGAGFAAVLAAGGAALKIKESSEPDSKISDKKEE